MKITTNIYPKINNYAANEIQQKDKTSVESIKNRYMSELPYFVDYSRVSFTGIKPPKRLNIENETRKLLRDINNILTSDIPECDIEDLVFTSMRKILSFYRNKTRKMQELLEKLENMDSQIFSSTQQRVNALNMLKKEFKAVQNSKPKNTLVKTSKPANDKNEKFDFVLLNRFKSAISANDFDLAKIFRQYYSGLNKISTIEELRKIYPKIVVPERPETIIGQKIEKTFTRDFYQSLVDNFDNPEKMCQLADNRIQNEIAAIAEKYDINPQILYDRLASSTHQAVLDTLSRIGSDGSGLNNIPNIHYYKPPQITTTDIDLLSIDYDDFVLSTIRRHYLGAEKLTDITYTDNLTGFNISVSSLKNTEYKFTKLPEKIKAMLKIGEQLKSAQRDYDNFNTQELKTRLCAFLNEDFAENDEIFEHIVNFDSCNFEPDDIPPLKKLLKELDALYDGKKTCDEVIKTIEVEDIRPRGTDQTNEAINQERIQALKREQQLIFKLNKEQQNFDSAMNILYEHNMNNLALICSKYRPEDLSHTSLENSQVIISTINRCLNSEHTQVNKTLLENIISRLDIFSEYAKTETNNPVFKRALVVATDENGVLNKEKAGQYLFNTEIIQNYPDSLSCVKNPDILEAIMTKCKNNPDAAMQYLSKYDAYTELFSSEKSKISKILELFDEKDSVDKIILKQIIESEYSKTDTSAQVFINNENNEFVTTTIAAKAKQQIIEKYKFPTCIKYLEAFENAISTFAPATNASGIKKVGSNNKALEYKYEVKVSGIPDRLFSTSDNYYFDVFSERGLH